MRAIVGVLAAVLGSAAGTSLQAAGVGVGMQVAGRVLVGGDTPCRRCTVYAYHASLDQAFLAATDGSGTFAFTGLPAGPYFLVALGEDRYLELSGGRPEPAISLVEGFNVSGVILQAPVRRTVTLQVGQSAAAPPEPQAATAVDLGCGDKPAPRFFNDVEFATFDRTDNQVEDKDAISCANHASALGCTQPTITSDEVEASCLGSRLFPVPWKLQTRIDVHGPGYPGFDKEPPPPTVCAKLTAGACSDVLQTYASHVGTVKHECAHRRDDEQRAAKIFDDLIRELKTIQDELDFCGGIACSCETEAIQERVNAALGKAAGRLKKHFYERTTRQGETPPEATECAHYKGQCP